MEKRIEKRAIEVVTKFFDDIFTNQGFHRAKFFMFNPGRATWGYEFHYERSVAKPFHLEKLDIKKKEEQKRLLRINEIDHVFQRIYNIVTEKVPLYHA